MSKHGALTGVSIVIFLCACVTTGASAQAFKTLINFDGTSGAAPLTMSLVQGMDGGIYGTTSSGGSGCGSAGCGTVFKITPSSGLVTIHAFCSENNCADGLYPQAGLVLATDGSFYGTTSGGGAHQYGTVFKITLAGVLTTLYSFNPSDGVSNAALIQGADGSFYGTTMTGGTYSHGMVFRITATGTFTAMYSFCGALNCTDGAYPRSALIQAADGGFYGTTTYGGANISYGTVFRITKGGVLTTLHSFDFSDGDSPIGGLVQGLDGNLYGTTANGGIVCLGSGCGTVFGITLEGTLATLHNFDVTDGSQPFSGMFRGNDGNFYGTTSYGGAFTCNSPFGSSCGTVFEVTPGGILTSLHTFDLKDGYSPNGLLQATNGTFYGTTEGGGVSKNCPQNDGCGTVFSLSTGLGPFVALVRGAGKVGQTGGILGQGFIGTTNVSFNGIPANFTVISDTFIRATVPAGVTTGYVKVITPSGPLTSNVPFLVIP